MSRLIIFLFYFFTAPFTSTPPPNDTTRTAGDAAEQAQRSYPKDYFRYPLNITPSLAGNFGDLRTNHYHMGLDIRTQQRENLPVVAAADGYVSHMRVGPYGYGRALFVTHPNGYTTVYGHLNDFYPELENYLHQQQYATESWEQDIDLAPGQFAVRKGQFIAYSGNTGGSQGPHLHFEIRDSGLANGHSRNPLLFDLGIPDHVPPALYRVGIFNRSQSIYEQGPRVYGLQKKVQGGTAFYAPAAPIIRVPGGKFSIGVAMEDKMENSFSFGVYRADLYVDDSLRNRYQIEESIYGDSRYINAGIDYFARYNGSGYMQHLSRLPGDLSPYYDRSAGNGVLQLTDDAAHEVEIVVYDVAGNKSVLRFNVQRDNDLRFQDNSMTGDVVQQLVPNQPGSFEGSAVQLAFNKNAVYDTLLLRYSAAAAPAGAVSVLHRIGDYRLPVHTPYAVRIKPVVPLPDDLKNKVMMVMHSGKKNDAQLCSWNAGWAAASWTNFGTFYLLVDTTAPLLRPVNVHDGATFINDRKLVFDAKDAIGDVASFAGYIDGRWIAFRQKSNRYTYDFDERCPPGRHTLRVKATDTAGNEAVFECSFVNAGRG